MNISSHVDVIMAEGEPNSADRAAVSPDVRETVDVAPDPSQRIIIIAPTKALGEEHAKALGLEPVAIVTPRSPHAANGMTADNIIEADGLTPDGRQALMVHAGPALATAEGN